MKKIGGGYTNDGKVDNTGYEYQPEGYGWGEWKIYAVVVLIVHACLSFCVLVTWAVNLGKKESPPEDYPEAIGIFLSIFNILMVIIGFVMCAKSTRMLHLLYLILSALMVVMWLVAWAVDARVIDKYALEPAAWDWALVFSLLLWIAWFPLLVLVYHTYKENYGTSWATTDLRS